MKYSILAIFFLMSVSVFAAAPLITISEPLDGSWIPPFDDVPHLIVSGKVSGFSPKMKLNLEIGKVVIPVKVKPDGNFEAVVDMNYIRPIDEFRSFFVLKEKEKVISKVDYRFYCCAIGNEGVFAELKKGTPDSLAFRGEKSILHGLTVAIPGESIKSNVNAILRLHNNISIPDEKYIPVSYQFSFRSSDSVIKKGLLVTVPFDVSIPRMWDGFPISKLLYLSKFGREWVSPGKSNLLAIAEVNGDLVELPVDRLSDRLVQFTLPDERDFEDFVIVARRVVKSNDHESGINKKSEEVDEKIELQPLTAPNVPGNFVRGCRCEIGDIVLQKGVMGYKDVLIQRFGKYEELIGLDDIDEKRINDDKSLVTFSAANKKLNVSFSCERTYVNSDSCNEGGCGEVLYKCDVEAKSKNGKVKKRYEKLDGNCMC